MFYIQYMYVLSWFAMVFGINSMSKAGSNCMRRSWVQLLPVAKSSETASGLSFLIPFAWFLWDLQPTSYTLFSLVDHKQTWDLRHAVCGVSWHLVPNCWLCPKKHSVWFKLTVLFSPNTSLLHSSSSSSMVRTSAFISLLPSPSSRSLMALLFSNFLHSSNSQSLMMLDFAPAFLGCIHGLLW